MKKKKKLYNDNRKITIIVKFLLPYHPGEFLKITRNQNPFLTDACFN
jgi:hypothetical protein